MWFRSLLNNLYPHMRDTVVIVANVHVPGPATHLAVLDVGLDRPTGRIDADCYGLAAVGAAHLGLGVPGIVVTGLRCRVRIV